jgi:hypothetical protein
MALAQQNDLFGTVPEKVQDTPTKPTESPLDFLQRTEVQAMHKLQREQPTLASMAAEIIVDPGADIHPDDSELWLMLLSRARKVDKNLQAILAYLRGGGAKMVESNRFGYAIVAIIDPSGVNGWPSQEMYNREKQYIGVYGEKLKALLWQLRHPKPTQDK